MAPTMKYWDDWVDVEDMEAMWHETYVSAEWVAAGEKQGHKVHMSRNSDGKPYVTQTEMRAMARIIIKRHFKDRLDPLMICAIAEIESDRQPLAYRYEPKIGEASTGLMQTLQSTADWLARDMGYTYYTREISSSILYRPFVSVYFGAAFLKWLSTYERKDQSEEFMVRAYNGGPKHATSKSTLVYWNKYLRAKQTLQGQRSQSLDETSRILEGPNLMQSAVSHVVASTRSSGPSSGKKWIYWDEKTSSEDMDVLWRHEEVKKDWLKSGEQVGKVRFACDSELRPFLTRTELKAVAEAVLLQHFKGQRLQYGMLCAVAEVCSKRLLYGLEPPNGLLHLSVSTAQWLHNTLGYKAYNIHSIEDLHRPFVSMYFAASYMCWLSTFEGRQRDDQFIVKAYLVGPQNVNTQRAGQYWLKYLEALPRYRQHTER